MSTTLPHIYEHVQTVGIEEKRRKRIERNKQGRV